MKTNLHRLVLLAAAFVWLNGTQPVLASPGNCTCNGTYDGYLYVLVNDWCGEGYVAEQSSQPDDSSCASWCLDEVGSYATNACSFECDNPPYSSTTHPGTYRYSAYWYNSDTNDSGDFVNYYGSC